MKNMVKQILKIATSIMMLTNMSQAKKEYVPILMDDLLSMSTYYTTTNELKIPILSPENKFRDLVLQCDEDITYFLMAYKYYDYSSISASVGKVIVDENVTIVDENLAYTKGYIEGNESIVVTAKVYGQDPNYGEITSEVSKSCNRSGNLTPNRLEVPTFNGNSQGKLVIQCEDDVVYYIMAYDCLRQDTNPSASTDNGTLIVDEKKHVGEVFYEKGHVLRTDDTPVTITGEVFSGGKVLDTMPGWVQTCP